MYLFCSPEKSCPAHISVPKILSPTHIHPSPTKMRMRKSRHRRSNSKGAISTSNSSPVKSPTKDALHDELQSKQINLRHVDRTQISASTFNFLGPATALREFGSPTEHKTIPELDLIVSSVNCDKNLNDVCFGCEGQCSDVTCSSKETTPSRESADVESNTCDSLYDTTPSPSAHVENIVELQKQNDENDLDTKSKSSILNDLDSNENLKSSCIPIDCSVPIIEITKGDNCHLDSNMKRSISEVEFSPSNPPSPLRLDSMEEDNFVGQTRNSVRYRHRKVSSITVCNAVQQIIFTVKR